MHLLKNLAFLGVFLASSAFAYGPADEQQIQKDIKLMERYAKKGDMVKSFEMLPPKMIAKISEMTGKSPKEMKTLFASMGKAMADKNNRYTADVKNAQVGKTKDGVEYVIMDAKSVMMGMAMQDKLVAIFEDGKWYYVRPNGNQAQVLQELYGIEVE